MGSGGRRPVDRMENLQAVSQEQAARAFAVCVSLNPSGHETAESMAARGSNFQLTTGRGAGIYGVRRDGETLWCIAAAGQGAGLASAGLQCLERQARANRCNKVGFQTMRRGLVRIAEKQGYEVVRQVGAGFVLEKRV